MTEHVEGDACKFALWVGRTPTSDNKIVLKVWPHDVKSDDKGAKFGLWIIFVNVFFREGTVAFMIASDATHQVKSWNQKYLFCKAFLVSLPALH